MNPLFSQERKKLWDACEMFLKSLYNTFLKKLQKKLAVDSIQISSSVLELQSITRGNLNILNRTQFFRKKMFWFL